MSEQRGLFDDEGPPRRSRGAAEAEAGSASDAAAQVAVVDARGRIHGLDNAYVADASIMPVIPRANTNLPALVIGERIARWLLESSGE